MNESDREKLLGEIYVAFNERAVDEVLSGLSGDVDWPNAWEGGRVIGHEAVRDYWARQWAEIDPSVEPISFSHRSANVVAVEVHQVARDLQGNVLGDGVVLHVYEFEGGLVKRMDVEEIAGAD